MRNQKQKKIQTPIPTPLRIARCFCSYITTTQIMSTELSTPKNQVCTPEAARRRKRGCPSNDALPLSDEAFVVSLKQSPEDAESRNKKLQQNNSLLHARLREATAQLAATTAELAVERKDLVDARHKLLIVTGELTLKQERLVVIRNELDSWIVRAHKDDCLARHRKELLGGIWEKKDGKMECVVSLCGAEMQSTERKVKLECGCFAHAQCAASLACVSNEIQCPKPWHMVRSSRFQVVSLPPKAEFVGSLTEDQIYSCELRASEVLQELDDIHNFFDRGQDNDDDDDYEDDSFFDRGQDNDDDSDSEMIPPPSGVVAPSPVTQFW